MPYKIKKGTKCVVKADTGKKVGCTKGPVKKYLAALNINAHENKEMKLMNILKEIGVFEKKIHKDQLLKEMDKLVNKGNLILSRLKKHMQEKGYEIT